MAKKEIKTRIDIQATPEKIWEILTAFSEYKHWNPFITTIQGDIAVGNKIKIIAGGMNFTPRVLIFEKNKELRWMGTLGFRGLFDGEHRFAIKDNQNGTSAFIHEETFSGLLVGWFAKKLDSETRTGFTAMNQKLKEIAERREVNTQTILDENTTS